MSYLYFDQAVIDNLQTIMGEEFVELYRVYARDSQQRLEQLEQLLEESVHPEKIRLAAHSIKGSSANVGASGMASLCFQLEQMAQTDSLAEAGELFEEIKSLYALMKPEIEALAKLPASDD